MAKTAKKPEVVSETPTEPRLEEEAVSETPAAKVPPTEAQLEEMASIEADIEAYTTKRRKELSAMLGPFEGQIITFRGNLMLVVNHKGKGLILRHAESAAVRAYRDAHK